MGRDYFKTIYKAENEEAEIPYRVHRRSYKQIGVTIFFSYEECSKALAKANSKRRLGTFEEKTAKKLGIARDRRENYQMVVFKKSPDILVIFRGERNRNIVAR